jgi:hypothetical protein
MANQSKTQRKVADAEKDAELKAFAWRAGYQEVVREEGVASISEYEKSELEVFSRQVKKDQELMLAGAVPDTHARLDFAVKRAVRLDDDAVIWQGHRGWLLLGRALLARHTWHVQTLSFPDGDSPTGRTIYVHLGDFRAWVRAQGKIPRTETKPATGNALPKRTRTTRIRIAVEDARTALITKHKRKPTFDEVFHYLVNHDETGHIVDATDDAVT